MAFQIAYSCHCSPFSFDNVDFWEFSWMFERSAKQKESENKQKSQQSGQVGLESIFAGGSPT
jgi:hypothetical protein